ncbi:MAG TPA: YwqG family protein, partial [Gemmatimonadaceae bacterium]|nr:YwqG family protein [Gemmatimonadaceae bacterium]
ALLALSPAEGDAYRSLWEVLGLEPTDGGTAHQVLGHAIPVQGDMQVECQLVTNGLYCGDPSGYGDPRAAALRPGARDWRLLFQLDSDEGAGLMWGDVGRLYFWMREQDLSDGRFDRAWMQLQCA